MDELLPLLIALAICFVLTGPIAFVICLVLLSHNRKNSERLDFLESYSRPKPVNEQKQTPITKAVQEIPEQVISPPPPPKPVPVQMPMPVPKQKPDKPVVLLEQRIGTQWILIAGITSVLVGVAFLLKYAVENFTITPVMRVVGVAVAGLICLAVGEISRRRSYEIVAKGVAALGFALLYAAVFAAYQIHHMLDMLPAFLLAAAITASAMAYAAVLDEVIIAFVSLLGGFGTPILILDGFSSPMRLFVYVIILSVGAMAVASYRKWRSVNILSFIGSYALYVIWYDQASPFYGIGAVALSWLAVFFVIYLVMPLMYEIVRKVDSKVEDVILVLANSLVAFAFSWDLLADSSQKAMTLVVLLLAVAHFAMAFVVTRRNKHDTNLRIVLTAIGIVCVTIAIPLHFKMYDLTIVWISEGIVLAVIGLRYRSTKIQIVSLAPLLLSLSHLLYELPLHSSSFQLLANPEFGLWLLLTVALLVYHLIFRFNKTLFPQTKILVSKMTYAFLGLVMFFALTAEWGAHCDINIQGDALARQWFASGMIVLALLEMFFFAAKPVSPSGNLCSVLTLIATFIGTFFSVILLSRYRGSFVIFANVNFAVVFIFVLGLFVLASITKCYASQARPDSITTQIPAALVIWAVILLLVLITEQIWYYFDYSTSGIAYHEGVVTHMWISIAWAIYGTILMVIGFATGSRYLRYIALGLFAVLLAKVFLIDTQNMQSIYRITALLATGITLVGISYLYQFLKKKGFFEKILIERSK